MSDFSHDEGTSNTSGNRPFNDVLRVYSSRREVIVGGMAAATTTFFAGTGTAQAHGSKSLFSRFGWGVKHYDRPKIDFAPVSVADGTGPVPTISEDYEYQVLIPWGTSLIPGWIPTYDGDPTTRPTAHEQAYQVGIGHDGMWYFPLRSRGNHWWQRFGWWDYDPGCWDQRNGWWGNHHGHEANDHGVLVINFEYGTNPHLLGKDAPESLEDVRLSQHGHGVGVIEIRKKRSGEWEPVLSQLNRRIHVNTPVQFSGPVRHSPLLQTQIGNRPLGTVNNCANGYTPWGTYLTCEENFNGYFGATGAWTATQEQQRYGFSANGFGYGWQHFDPRFDLSNADYTNEENRFGWVVEIDPMDPDEKPVKRTALGRFKHEGVALTVGKHGRVVAYMGDDERFDYVYKFVSSQSWTRLRARGQSPLDHGRLYVARFNDNGTGDWLELTIDNPFLAARFSSQEEVLTYARISGDLLGATPMDRPEWASVDANGEVYMTLTNNSNRSVGDAANPNAPNPHGHIIKWKDSDEHVGTSFVWDIFVFGQDTQGTEDSFSSPDGLWADPDGRLFIQTDGGQEGSLNNQMLVACTKTGEIRRLFTGVTNDEITGIAVTPDRRTMFINTQHPGDGDPNTTNFPAPQGSGKLPRDCTFVIRRKDGGIIGS